MSDIMAEDQHDLIVSFGSPEEHDMSFPNCHENHRFNFYGGTIWDIKQPRSKWARHYAWLEYRRIGEYALWNYVKHIEVTGESEENWEYALLDRGNGVKGFAVF